MYTPDRDRSRALDGADPLAPFLQRFVPAPEGVVYFDGNSLGQLPRATRDALRHAVDVEWGQRLIRSWSEGWMELPQTIGDTLGTHLLGAAPGQTVLADSTTVNFYKLADAALGARGGRTRIVTDDANFPTDRYVLESLASRHGATIDWVSPPTDPETLDPLITEQTALVTFSHVDYRTAHIADMRAITDLAVGCTYKYLNGGPGAPAFLYVNQAHHDRLAQPIWGWIGRRDPFAMGPGYDPATGITQMISGTPAVLGLTAARIGIELSAEATIAAIREKSILLTTYAIDLADAIDGITVGSPREPGTRGGHVALTHQDARRLSRELIESGVIVDFREPDVIRVGLSPLTTRFEDVRAGLERLAALAAR